MATTDAEAPFGRELPGLLAAVVAGAVVLCGYWLFAGDGAERWQLSRLVGIALLTAVGRVVLLGVPALLLLRQLRRVRWWSVLATGFVIGGLPQAIAHWPSQGPPGVSVREMAWGRMVTTVADGTPTLQGWLHFSQDVALAGCAGAIGALAFWLARRRGFTHGRPQRR